MMATLPERKTDSYGSGHYGAIRTSSDRKGQKKQRGHNGKDFACYPNTTIHSTIHGTVTKLGYPYGDDLSFRYVQITDIEKNDHRFFYVEPSVNIGDKINSGQAIGKTQKLGDRYPPKKNFPITEHLHYEVKDKDGKYIDPEIFL